MAVVGESMLSTVLRPRFVVMGTNGTYLKKEFDPLESVLRTRTPGPGESWMLEKPENFGEVTQVEGENVRKWKVESFGDWRDFYLNVRGGVFGEAGLQGSPEQALRVVGGVGVARGRSAKRGSGV